MVCVHCLTDTPEGTDSRQFRREKEVAQYLLCQRMLGDYDGFHLARLSSHAQELTALSRGEITSKVFDIFLRFLQAVPANV